MKAEQQRVCDLLKDTVAQLCSSGLHCSEQLRIQAVIGITVDETDAFIVHIDETIQKPSTAAGDNGPNASSECPLATAKGECSSALPTISEDCEILATESPTAAALRRRARKRLAFSSSRAMQRLTDTASVVADGYGTADMSDIDLTNFDHAPLPDLTYVVCSIQPPDKDSFQSNNNNNNNVEGFVCRQPVDEALVVPDSDDDSEDVKFVDSSNIELRISNVVGSASMDCSSVDVDRKVQKEDFDTKCHTGDGSDLQWTRQSAAQPAQKRLLLSSPGHSQTGGQSRQQYSPSASLNVSLNRTPKANTHFSRQTSVPASPAGSMSHAPDVKITSPRLQFQQASPAPPKLNRSHPTTPQQTPATPRSLQRCADTESGSGKMSGGMMSGSPVLFKTMYVCNVGQCNRGFAYRKNMLRHQQEQHGSLY